jgi:hypothetical protein
MNKKKALGMDPLTWLKSKNKEEDLNNNANNQEKTAKKSGSGSVINLSSPKQKAREAKTNESGNMTGKFRDMVFGGRKSAQKSEPSAKGKSLGGMIFNGVGHEEKQAVKPFEPKVINLSDTEKKMRDVRTYEPSDVTEKYRSEILGERKSGRKSRFSTVGTKENPATIFVVVYTVLLLVLGFLVYKELTGKINKLDAKLTSIEKQIKEDAKFN